MAKYVSYKYNASYLLCVLCIAFIALCGCTQDDGFIRNDEQKVEVPLEISFMSVLSSKAIGDPVHSVDRILVLPFRKINEIVGNTDANFIPEFASAVQFDVNSFNYANTIPLEKGITYKVVVIGYNANDYDQDSPESPSRRFSLKAVEQPELLCHMHLEASDATYIPELFVAQCTSFNMSTPIGEYFKAEDITSLSGGLNRIVSGLTLEVTNIPDYVSSVSLTAEKLVKANRICDAMPVMTQSQSEGASNILETQIPVGGRVYFGKFLLPTFELNQTKLYLDVSYGSNLTRYEIRVNDVPGISSGNSITFSPNQVVRITGDYNQIDVGFLIDNIINLEDDVWDGIIR